MIKIDVLNLLKENIISLDEVYKYIDDAVDKFHSNLTDSLPQDLLCLNKYEWTAFCFGIDIGTLVDWRYNGWPTKCNNCLRDLNYINFGWRIVEDHLTCIRCDEINLHDR